MKRGKNIHTAKTSDCTGCGLCASVCSSGCIRMKEGFLGHLFPVIDKTTCVDCGLCERLCPAIHPMPLNPIRFAYASWTKDSVDYETSASGGIATELSKLIIRRGGVVYGCAMLPGPEVRHIRVDKLEDLDQLKSSKYVQSSIVGIIPSLKKDIAAGRQVLFIGTPCQVAAVKSLYGNQPESLYLVDVICHGVPSLKLLQQYVHEVIPDGNSLIVTFRDGPCYSLKVWNDNQALFVMPFRSPNYQGWYLDAFLDGYTFRDSCYKCSYAKSDRVGDVTIGDFWGLGKKNPADEIPDHPLGCSVILPVTDKGLHLMDEIRPYVNLFPREIQEAIEGNGQLQRPFPMKKRIRAYRVVQKVMSWPDLYRWINLDRWFKLRKTC